MAINLGTSGITKLGLGQFGIEKAYLGDVKVLDTLTEIYEQTNAASLADVDSIGSWVDVGASSISSVQSEAIQGVNSLHLVTGDTSANRCRYRFQAIAGNECRIVFWTKAGQGNKQRVQLWVNVDVSPDEAITESVWTKRTYIVKATTTNYIEIRVYTSTINGVIGDKIFRIFLMT